MSNQLTFAKLAVNLVASFGVSKVISDVIQNNTNVETTADAVKVAAGSLVLGSMVVSHASKYVNNQFDGAAAWYASRKAETAAK